MGRPSGARDVAAIVPFRTYAELQPIFGSLAGSAEAARLDMTLVASRSTAAETLPRLRDAFEFYGLQGSLVIARDKETTLDRIDSGVQATNAAHVLCWTPAALPRSPKWLDRLVEEADSLPDFGLISPALVYEDGSICFSGERSDRSGIDSCCARAGFAAHALPLGVPFRVSSGAPEIALIARNSLVAAGGFSGHCFSEAHAHIDLASRLHRAGMASYCSRAVPFWMLDDVKAARSTHFARLMQRVDASLLDGMQRLTFTVRQPERR
jgi:hypothetical protein